MVVGGAGVQQRILAANLIIEIFSTKLMILLLKRENVISLFKMYNHQRQTRHLPGALGMGPGPLWGPQNALFIFVPIFIVFIKISSQ